MAHRPPPSPPLPFFSIDRKSFSIDFAHGIRITESTKDRSFTLSLKKVSHLWLNSCFAALIAAPLNQKFFKESRLDEYVLWVEKVSTRKGHCAEIAKLGINGGLNKLIIPMGENKAGWNRFLSLLKEPNFPSPSPDARISYKGVLQKNPFVVSTNLSLPLTDKSTTIHNPSSMELAAFNPEKAIIVQRENFHDDWYEILRAIQREVTYFGSISPLQPNKAILAVESKEQGQIFCNYRDWYRVGAYRVKFEQWSTEAFYKEPKVPSYGGWIKVRNLPIDRWSIDIFKHIGDLCGGYLETSKKTLARMDMMEVSLKVNRNVHGFIPAIIHLPSSSSASLTVQIDPFFDSDPYIGYIVGIHGKIPLFSPENIPVSVPIVVSSPAVEPTRPQLPLASQKPLLHAPPTVTSAAIPYPRASQPCSSFLQPADHSPIASAPLPTPSIFSSSPPSSSRQTPQSIFDPSTSIHPPSAITSLPSTVPLPSTNISGFSSLPPPHPLSSQAPKLHPLPSKLSSPSFFTDPAPAFTKPSLKPVLTNNRRTHLVPGKIFSTNTRSLSSDTDDLLSSPCPNSVDDTPRALPPPSSPPSLSHFFDPPEPDLPLALIDHSTDTSLPTKALPIIPPPIVPVYPFRSGGIPPAPPSPDILDRPELISTEDPSVCLATLFPWLTKHGMCIMPIPFPKKQSFASAKKQRNWARELQNLHSSVNYEKKNFIHNHTSEGSNELN